MHSKDTSNAPFLFLISLFLREIVKWCAFRVFLCFCFTCFRIQKCSPFCFLYLRTYTSFFDFEKHIKSLLLVFITDFFPFFFYRRTQIHISHGCVEGAKWFPFFICCSWNGCFETLCIYSIFFFCVGFVIFFFLLLYLMSQFFLFFLFFLSCVIVHTRLCRVQQINHTDALLGIWKKVCVW